MKTSNKAHQSMQKDLPHIAAVIPCYKVKQHILALIAKIGPEVSAIYCIDDACPDHSGKYIQEAVSDPRVRVIFHAENQGVGGAVLTGFKQAEADGNRVAVKLDGDGQMDPAILSKFTNVILQGHADYTKGNRFYNPAHLRSMPRGRLVGNAILSFVSKFSTGYWNVFDPTNGYLALDLRLLKHMDIEKIDRRYFFETDLLFRAGIAKAKVLDIPMQALYDDEVSNLHFSKEATRFMRGHLRNFFKRIGYNYFLRDFSVASLELLVGLAALLFGLIYGIIKMGGSAEAQSAGVVMLAALPLLTGVILLVSFLNYDIQQTPQDPLGPRLFDQDKV